MRVERKKYGAARVAYEPTRLAIDGPMELDQYEALLSALGAMTRGHQWWVGDALVYGEDAFGEDTFSQAAEQLGLEPHTLTNWRWVASAVEDDRRREDLTWSHHAEVARLKAGQQSKMLAQAAASGWTVRQLRDAVALAYPTGDGDGPAEPPGDPFTEGELAHAAADTVRAWRALDESGIVAKDEEALANMRDQVGELEAALRP